MEKIPWYTVTLLKSLVDQLMCIISKKCELEIEGQKLDLKEDFKF
jgi:hypothetical protein